MKTQLFLLKSYLAMLFIFAISLMSSQTQLVKYSFNNNLNADGGALISESLTYHYSGGSIKIADYNGNMLTTNDAGDYLEFSADTSGQQNLILAFNGDFTGLFISGTWTVSANIGTGGSYVDIDNLTLYSIFNIPFPGNLSINLPAATENNPNLKIRVRSSFSYLGGDLRLDNLVLSSGAPKIKVYTNGNVDIPHLSPASVALTTDFMTKQTGTTTTKTFRVRNFQGTSGSFLRVDSIVVGGTNPEDFTTTQISNSSLSVVAIYNGSPYGTFNVAFVPTEDGVRSAEVKLYSNSAPNPYIFNVVGTGSSCNFVPGTYVINAMSATGTQTLPGNYADTDLIGGVANPATGNTLNTRLYPDGNLYTSSPTSWYVRNTEKTIEFGGLNVSNQKDVSINFRVAAFTTTTNGNGTSSTNSNNGLNSASYITLEVLKSDNTWSKEMRLQGSNATNRYYRNNYAATGVFNSNFTGANPNVTVPNGGTLYSTVQLNFQASDIINSLNNNLKFRITAFTNSNNRLWLIDDVKVLTSNSVYKTYTTAGVWSPSSPGPNDKAIIEGNYTVLPAGLSICECEVADGGSVTIPDGRTITVKGKVVNNGNGDNFVVQSGGNLIQVEDAAANMGSITVERYVNDMNNLLTGPNAQVDYVYWSTPVSGQGLQAFSPGTPANRIFRYNEPDDFFKVVNLTTEPNFVPGKGYAIRAETGGVASPVYDKTYKFKGTPNNGEITVPIFRSPNNGTVVHGYNLIGNPYPSNLNFARFYALNSSAIYNTAWFWTNNFYTAAQQGSGYTPNNYAIWNGSGGAPATTRAAADNNPNNPNNITAVPDGYVPSGQAFIIRAKNFGADTLTFKNKNGTSPLRVTNPGTFFHKDGEEAINRYWVKLISSDSIVNTQLIGYIGGATDEFENDYDAELLSLSSNAFYSILGDRKLQIQGRGLEFSQEDKVVLGANIFKNGSYTIQLENPEGIFAESQNVYLKDHLFNTLTNLNQDNYTFTATAGILEGRFEIVYEPQSTLLVEDLSKDDILIYRSGEDYVLRSAFKNIDEVEIFDMSGRLYKKLKGGKKELSFDSSSMPIGIYVLKIDREGEISTKKIRK